MMQIVVDASVIVEYLIDGLYTVNAEALFAQVTEGDDLIVPEFCLLECTNVLWKQMRFHGMTIQQAEINLKDLRELPLRRAPLKALLSQALRIGAVHQLAIYDSAYIALAARYACPLLTLDQPQTRAGLAEGITLKPLTDFT
jgi:predicted nucleic acid-binding protein